MHAKIALLSILFLVVLVSGCNSGLQLGNSVAILDFYTDFDEVVSGERVDFHVRVKNLGSVTAENTFAELLGLDVAWYDPQENALGGGPWISMEKLPNEEECRYTSGVLGNGFSLLPPNQFFGTEGEEHVCTWSYLAPDVPFGTSLPYNPKVRIYYDYKTTVTASVTLLPREEMIRLQNSGQTPPTHVISKSSSPIDIDIGIQPSIRVSGNGATFTMEIKITNVGSGVPCIKRHCKKHGEEKHVWDKITMNIDLGSLSSEDCEGDISVPLYKGYNTIICRINANLADLTIPQQKTININLDYSYFVDKNLFLEVVG